MSLAPTSKQIKALAELLSLEYESAEDAAEDALRLTWSMYEQRANYVVVGQLTYTAGQFVKPDDVKATKVAVGPFGTAGDAKAAGEALAVPSSKTEVFRWWSLPIHHGTPAVWHKARKDDREAAAAVASHDGDAARIAAAKAFGHDREDWPQETLV